MEGKKMQVNRKINQRSFGGKEHINDVREAARTLREAYKSCQAQRLLPAKRGNTLLLDTLSTKLGAENFDKKITALSLNGIQELLKKAVQLFKKSLYGYNKKIIKIN